MGKYKGVCLYDSENATGTTGKVFVHRRVIDFAWHPLGSRSQWKAITEIVEGSTSTSVGDEGIVNDPRRSLNMFLTAGTMEAWTLVVYVVCLCLMGHCMNIMLRACVRGLPPERATH